MKTYFKIFILLFTISAFSQEKEKQKNPHEELEYLIGTWEIDFGQGIGYMTFEWGPHKTYITCTNEHTIKGVRSQENFSLIIWDGVNGNFAVNTSYTSPGNLLYGHGTMTIKDGLMARDLAVNYSEGQNMPFLKRKAGKGGFRMPYRQRWKIIDENTFEGVFEVFVDGKFIDPFKRKEKETWKRIK
ncbi:MAG: hypothetical protein QNJ57_10800 [Flavobacteriaceae bacterium]|nr:hypothetical protein [Flavobacteriaceae bacterium]